MRNCFLMVLVSIAFFACRKETDIKNPVIDIWLPSDYQVFTMTDSIRVQGIASDETKLSYIQITLTDRNYLVRDKQISIPVDQNPKPFDVWYTITNEQLEGGDYYIQVRASDGVNTKFRYKPVRLIRDSPVLTSLLIVTRPDANSFALGMTDTLFSAVVPLMQYPHRYSGSAVSQESKQLYLLGRGFGECYAIDLEDYTLDFNLAQTGTPSLDYHEGIMSYGGRFYLGLSEGYVRGYNKLGAQQLLATMATGKKPCAMMVHDQLFLVVAEEQNTGPGSWIASYYLSSGDKHAEYKLPDAFEVTAIQSLNNQEVLLAGNLNGSGRLVLWNPVANVLSTPLQLASHPISDMIKLNANQFLLSVDNEVLLYQTASQTALPYLPHPGATRLRIDPGTGILFVGNPKTLTAYNINTKALVWQQPLQDSLADFHLQYDF